jgi:hypothetical protein
MALQDHLSASVSRYTIYHMIYHNIISTIFMILASNCSDEQLLGPRRATAPMSNCSDEQLLNGTKSATTNTYIRKEFIHKCLSWANDLLKSGYDTD